MRSSPRATHVQVYRGSSREAWLGDKAASRVSHKTFPKLTAKAYRGGHPWTVPAKFPGVGAPWTMLGRNKGHEDEYPT